MRFHLILALLAGLAPTPQAQLSNPGFEENAAGWTIREKSPMTSVKAEAAHTGNMGLRVEDADEVNGSSALSAPLKVTGKQPLKLSFWQRAADSGKAGVVLWFYDANRQLMKDTQPTAPVRGNGNWQQVNLDATAPEGAETVSIWIRSYSTAKTSFDLDDFSLTAADGSQLMPAALLPPVRSQAAGPKTPPAPRTSPPYIIIKVDDMKGSASGVNRLWIRLTDFLAERNIPASIGIICDSLEADNPKYFQWIKDQQATGRIEFWNHGYDHKQWEENGQTLQEFKGPSLEQQKDHLLKSNALAKAKLGFPLVTFGAPFNAGDTTTVKALEADPDTRIVLYGNPKTPGGKVVLDRVYQVNIENPTFRPNVEKFIQGYNQFPQRDYFVIQGHPTHWDDNSWDQFVKIIDFLAEQKAIFVTPSQYVKIKGLQPQL